MNGVAQVICMLHCSVEWRVKYVKDKNIGMYKMRRWIKSYQEVNCRENAIEQRGVTLKARSQWR